MILVKELCKYGTLTIPQDHEWNMIRLHWVMNVIRIAYGKPMIVDSGYRTDEDQIEIYFKRGQEPKMGSFHLCGAACDIADPDGSLAEWCKNNEALLEWLGVYCEDFSCTMGWVHFQIYAPASGKRFFKP